MEYNSNQYNSGMRRNNSTQYRGVGQQPVSQRATNVQRIGRQPVNDPRMRRTVRGASKKGGIFKDKNGKVNVLGKVAIALAAAGIISTGAAIGNGIEDYQDHQFVRGEYCEEITGAIDENYKNSGYLMTSIPKEAYDKYIEEVLVRMLKSEKNLQKFLEENNVDGETWAYILTGEADRDGVSEAEIEGAFDAYSDYKSKPTFSKSGEPDNIVSLFTTMYEQCGKGEDKADLLALFDAVRGADSLANGKDALKYEKLENEEKVFNIQRASPEELKWAISTNNNFDENRKEDKKYLYAYCDAYNSIIDSIQKILAESAETKNREILQKILDKYKDYDKMDEYWATKKTYLGLATEAFLEGNEILGNVGFADYRAYRNGLYEEALESKSNPGKAIETIEGENASIDSTGENQDRYGSKPENYLREMLKILENKEINASRFRESGFGDFSR